VPTPEVTWSKLLYFRGTVRMAADSKYQKEEGKRMTLENLHVFRKNWFKTWSGFVGLPY
jgi:hypothetical protein